MKKIIFLVLLLSNLSCVHAMYRGGVFQRQSIKERPIKERPIEEIRVDEELEACFGEPYTKMNGKGRPLTVVGPFDAEKYYGIIEERKQKAEQARLSAQKLIDAVKIRKQIKKSERSEILQWR